MEPLARDTWGEPNARLSSRTDLRWGQHGSRSVDLAAGCWYDHEAKEGGGVLDFLRRELGLEKPQALDHLREVYGADLDERHPQSNGTLARALRGESVTVLRPDRVELQPSQAPPARRDFGRVVAEYDYTDEHGEVLFQAIRLEPKDFRQRRPATEADREADAQRPAGEKARVKAGGWVWTLGGVRQVPYRLPELLSMERRGRIYLCEGEKDVDALAALGLQATTNAMGAGKWPAGLSEHFTGLDVVILPDHDEAGEAHVCTVAPELVQHAKSVRVLRLPGLREKGDVSDWLDGGGGAEALERLADQAERWSPEPPPQPLTTAPARKGFPRELTRVPGLVGGIASWITSTARYPQPALALGAALTVVGTAAGRRVAGPTESGTHLYTLALAPTGGGKNHAPKMAQKLMRAAGLGRHVGPGQFMSMSAVYDAMARQPLLASFQDEFGALLARVNGQAASGHEKAISGVLRTLWGASFETVMPPAWAASSSRKDPEPIHAPALSIFGSSTPEEFYAALSGAEITNGFLNRFLLLAADTKPQEVEPQASSFDVPADLAEALKRLAGGDVLNADTLHAAGVDAPEIVVDWASADVRQTAKAFRLELEDRMESAALLTRTYEMAVRLATVRAIGVSLDQPRIDAAGWAQAVALWSAERMIADAREHMAEGENQRQSRIVERYVRDAGQITRKDLYRKVDGRISARLLSELLSGLEAAGLVETRRDADHGGRRGPPPVVYAYTGETVR